MADTKYTPPKFGSMKWLSVMAGYQKVRELTDKDPDVKAALKDMLLYEHIERLPLEIYADILRLYYTDCNHVNRIFVSGELNCLSVILE